MSDSKVCCKTGRLLSHYSLHDQEQRLRDEWINGKSVRTLCSELNRAVIREELDAAGANRTTWDISLVTDILRGNGTDEVEQFEVKRELDRNGIKVDEVSSRLVSHQTVYRHLTDCLGASKTTEVSPEKRRQRTIDTVFALQQRLEAVSRSALERLTTSDITDVGSFDILVDIRVVCSKCGRSMDFQTAVHDGCDCEEL